MTESAWLAKLQTAVRTHTGAARLCPLSAAVQHAPPSGVCSYWVCISLMEARNLSTAAWQTCVATLPCPMLHTEVIPAGIKAPGAFALAERTPCGVQASPCAPPRRLGACAYQTSAKLYGIGSREAVYQLVGACHQRAAARLNPSDLSRLSGNVQGATNQTSRQATEKPLLTKHP